MTAIEGAAEPADATADEFVFPYLTPGSVVVGLLLLAFGWLQVDWAEGQTAACYYRMGAFHGTVVQAGEWQRFWTAAWLHLSFKHWLYNAAITLLLVSSAQLMTTTSWSLLICVLGSFAGYAIELWTIPDRISLGLSGGTFALMGACIVAGWTLGFRENDQRKQFAGGMGSFLLVCQIPGLFDTETSHRAHLAGLLTGLLIGGLMCNATWHRWMKAVSAVLLVAYFLTLGWATYTLWDRTQPWALGTPEPLETLAWPLGQTTIELDIPATQIDGSEYEEWESGELRLTCGEALADPVIFSLITWEYEPNSELTLPLAEPEYARRVAEPVEVIIDGHRFWYLDYVSAEDESIALPRWIGRVHGRNIDLELSISPEANASWSEYARQIGKHLRFVVSPDVSAP